MARIHFDDYELGPVIGSGTVGTIYRVTEKKSQRIAALKLLLPAVSEDKLIVSRFTREMMILEKLHHPNIVSYFGGGRHKGQLFYVMELVDGGTVKELLAQNGPLPWGEAAECGRQVALALQHAHNFGIIHRDLKPGNIFLTLDGTCKLGDFGIARDLHALELTDAGLTVGTYAYMAPELVRGRREITGKVDLYALGCVLFEMLTGRTPFTGDNFAEIFEQHLHAEPPAASDFVAECPPELDRLIHELLAKDPEQRPFNAREVQGRLGEVCQVQPAVVQRQPGDRAADQVRPFQQSLRERISARVQPREVSWRRLSLVLAVMVLILAAMLWWQVRSQNDPNEGSSLPPAASSSKPSPDVLALKNGRHLLFRGVSLRLMR